MAENSSIEWTDHTFNPWIGCTMVSPGCVNCYAATQDKFRKWTPDGWGKGKPRKRTSVAYWKDPLKWNHHAPMMAHERRPRVFCASLADWLDDEVPIEWLADLLGLIQSTPHLDWLLLSKRPQLWRDRISAVAESGFAGELARKGMYLAEDWFGGEEPPANVWIGTTVEDQTRADERIPHLLRIPARVRFLSCEPLLGAIDISYALPTVLADKQKASSIRSPLLRGMAEQLIARDDAGPMVHWVIAGGESGPGARPMYSEWARSLRDQCAAAGVAFFFKQWGEWAPGAMFPEHIPSGECCDFDGTLTSDDTRVWRVGKKAAGRLLDGIEHNAFPEVTP
jgi:protein gp37